MFSNYIVRKTKTFIVTEKYAELNKMVKRLKKRGDICLFFWYLDDRVSCKSHVWENVYEIFREHVNLWPVRISPKCSA